MDAKTVRELGRVRGRTGMIRAGGAVAFGHCRVVWSLLSRGIHGLLCVWDYVLRVCPRTKRRGQRDGDECAMTRTREQAAAQLAGAEELQRRKRPLHRDEESGYHTAAISGVAVPIRLRWAQQEAHAKYCQLKWNRSPSKAKETWGNLSSSRGLLFASVSGHLQKRQA